MACWAVLWRQSWRNHEHIRSWWCCYLLRCFLPFPRLNRSCYKAGPKATTSSQHVEICWSWADLAQSAAISINLPELSRANITSLAGLRLGVKYVAQPGGSVADAEVIEACNTYGMAWLPVRCPNFGAGLVTCQCAKWMAMHVFNVSVQSFLSPWQAMAFTKLRLFHHWVWWMYIEPNEPSSVLVHSRVRKHGQLWMTKQKSVCTCLYCWCANCDIYWIYCIWSYIR